MPSKDAEASAILSPLGKMALKTPQKPAGNKPGNTHSSQVHGPAVLFTCTTLRYSQNPELPAVVLRIGAKSSLSLILMSVHI